MADDLTVLRLDFSKEYLVAILYDNFEASELYSEEADQVEQLLPEQIAIDDTSGDGEIRKALQTCGGVWADSCFTVLSCQTDFGSGVLRGVGLGSSVKKRNRAGRVAIGIGILLYGPDLDVAPELRMIAMRATMTRLMPNLAASTPDAKPISASAPELPDDRPAASKRPRQSSDGKQSQRGVARSQAEGHQKPSRKQAESQQKPSRSQAETNQRPAPGEQGPPDLEPPPGVWELPAWHKPATGWTMQDQRPEQPQEQEQRQQQQRHSNGHSETTQVRQPRAPQLRGTIAMEMSKASNGQRGTVAQGTSRASSGWRGTIAQQMSKGSGSSWQGSIASEMPQGCRVTVVQEASTESSSRSGIMCANPTCWYLINSDAKCGGYCCRKCHWVFESDSKTKKKHGPACEKVLAPANAPRAAADAPTDIDG